MKNPLGRPRKINRHIHPTIKMLHVERIKRKLSLADLTEILGCGKDTLGSWERGDYSPSITNMNDWCDSLGHELKVERKK